MQLEQRLRRLESLVESSYTINESFKSSAVRQFVSELRKVKGKGKYIFGNGDLGNLDLSRLSEDNVIFIKPEQATKYLDPKYIVFWGSNSKKEVKYIPPSYSSRSGMRSDNSVYANPGVIAMTQGKKFVRLLNGKFDTLSSSYDLPAQGYLSYLKLRTEIADYALVIDAEEIIASRDSRKGIRSGRRDAQKDSLILDIKNGINIANRNIERYRKQLKINVGKSATKALTDRANKALQDLKNEINSTSLSDILSLKKQTYHWSSGDAEELYSFDKKTLQKLEVLTTRFNEIAYKAGYFVEVVIEYGADHRNATRIAEELEYYLKNLGY